MLGQNCTRYVKNTLAGLLVAFFAALSVTADGQNPKAKITGLIYFYAGTTCATGDTPVPGGYLIKTMNTGSGIQPGTTAGAPLMNKEDRQHRHVGTIQTPLTVKKIRAREVTIRKGVSTGAAKLQPDHPVFTGYSPSGLPFIQLLACIVSADSQTTTSALPKGATAFVATTACPAPTTIWNGSSLQSSYFWVSALPDQDVPATVGSPVDGISHSHAKITGNYPTGEVNFAASADGDDDYLAQQSDSNTITGSTQVKPIDTDGILPTIRYIACKKQASGANEEGPPQEAIVFFDTGETDKCPDGWSDVPAAWRGRYIVTLPEGGEAAATFGTDPDPDDTKMLTHDHTVAAAAFFGLSLQAAGVGAAYGSTAKGYAAAGGITSQNAVTQVDTSNPPSPTNSAVNAAYTRLRLCQMNAPE